jgi:hypothetical protein
MSAGIGSFLDAAKKNKGAAIFGVCVLGILSFTNSPDAMATLPEQWRPAVQQILNSVKYGMLAYGAYAASKGLSGDEIHKKLTEIQSQPNQTVLPPKELVEAAPVLQTIASAPVSTEVVISTSMPSNVAKKTPKKKIVKKTAKKVVKKKAK